MIRSVRVFGLYRLQLHPDGLALPRADGQCEHEPHAVAASERGLDQPLDVLDLERLDLLVLDARRLRERDGVADDVPATQCLTERPETREQERAGHPRRNRSDRGSARGGWSDTRCTVSTAAQRTSRLPCLVIRPRCTVVSDS